MQENESVSKVTGACWWITNWVWRSLTLLLWHMVSPLHQNSHYSPGIRTSDNELIDQVEIKTQLYQKKPQIMP